MATAPNVAYYQGRKYVRWVDDPEVAIRLFVEAQYDTRLDAVYLPAIRESNAEEERKPP